MGGWKTQEQRKIWEVKNKEKISLYNAKWLETHREQNKERCRKYYKNHKNERKEYKKTHRKTFKEQINLYLRKWRKLHPEARKREIALRRELGFNVIWKPEIIIEPMEYHHVNINDVILIPERIHRSVKHNIRTEEGVENINNLVLKYIEEEERKKRREA